MSAHVASLRAARATRSLVAAGWERPHAIMFAGALESMPSSIAAFAHARRVFRPLGISAKETREWLVEVGYIDAEPCAHCSRPIRARACRVLLHARSYCNESCCMAAVDAGRAS